MILCNYGCGNEAKFKFKNENWCCESNVAKCPNVKNKTIGTLKDYNKITKPCKFCKNEFSSPNFTRHEGSCYLNPNNLKLCPICNEPIKDYAHTTTCSSSCANEFFKAKYIKGRIKEISKQYRINCFRYHEEKCIICGETNIVHVHHIDGNKDNNEIINLLPLCPTHHCYLHHGFAHLIIDKINEYIESFSSSIGRALDL